LVLALALKVRRFMRATTEPEAALSMRNQTEAPAAQCAPLHDGALLGYRDITARRSTADAFLFR
jgi:hypothetical protein